MPKECTHWILAERFRVRYGGSRVGRLLRKHRHLYLVGAVLPDSPFYKLSGRWRSEFTGAAGRLHGVDGHNTLSFLGTLAETWGGPLPDWVQALALGVVCHIMTDSQFHPMVYYFCGTTNHHRGAVLRHYQFETHLDLHYRSLAVTPGRGRLVHLLPYGYRWESFLRAVELIYFGADRVPAHVVATTLWRHAVAQRLFYTYGLRNLLESLGKVPGIDTVALASLFYPEEPMELPFFDDPIVYEHPVTGEHHREKLVHLENRAAKLIHGVFDLFEEGPPDVSVLRQLQGKSAITGLDAGSREPMQHFSIRRIRRLVQSPPSHESC